MRWSLAIAILVAACAGSKRVPSTSPRVATAQDAPAPPRISDPPRPHREAATWDSADHDWILLVLKELRETGRRDGHPQLAAFADRVAALVQQVDDGQLARTPLLEAFHAAEHQMTDPLGAGIHEKLDDLREAMRPKRVRE